MIIIGITGTLGAGKGTVVEYLKTKYGFLHFSASGFITEEILRRGMEVNRDSMNLVANDLRSKNGPAYIIEKLYEKASDANQNSIIESIHTIGETEALRKKGQFYLLAVDADLKIRYERISLRKSSKDMISFEKFSADQLRETASEDSSKQNLRACIELADYKIMNDSSLENLHSQIDKIMGSL